MKTQPCVIPRPGAPTLPIEIWRQIIAPLNDADFLAASRTDRCALGAGSEATTLGRRWAAAYGKSPSGDDAWTMRAGLAAQVRARSNFLANRFEPLPLTVAHKEIHPRRSSRPPPPPLREIVFCADGSRVATRHGLEQITIWDVSPAGLNRAVRMPSWTLGHSMVFSYDGTRLAEVPPNYRWDRCPVLIWDLQARPPAILRAIHGHRGDPLLSAFTPDGRYFILASENDFYDGHVTLCCLFDVTRPLLSFRDREHYAHSVELSAHGAYLSFVFAGQVAYLIDLRPNEPSVRTLPVQANCHTDICIAPDEKTYLRTDMGPQHDVSQILPIDAEAPVADFKIMTDRFYLTHASFSPNGRHLISGRNNEPLVLIDLHAGAGAYQVLLANAPRALVKTKFSPNSTYLASYCDGYGPRRTYEHLTLWRLADAIPRRRHVAEDGDIVHFQFWGQGSCLAVTLGQGVTLAYDLDAAFATDQPEDVAIALAGTALSQLPPTCGPVRLSPDGFTVVAAAENALQGHPETSHAWGAWSLAVTQAPALARPVSIG